MQASGLAFLLSVALLAPALALVPAAEAAASAPYRFDVTPESGHMATRFAFDASAYPAALGRELLYNPDFRDGLTYWDYSARELGVGSFSAARDANGTRVVFAPYSLERDATASLTQLRALVRAPAYALAIDAEAPATPYTVSVTMREQGYDLKANKVTRKQWDTPLGSVTVSERGTSTLAFTPRFPDTARVVLMLKVAVPAHASPNATLLLHHVSLRPAALFEWDFDGNGKADATGPRAETTLPREGAHAVVLSVTEIDRKRSTFTREVAVANAPPEGVVRVPASLVVGVPATFRVADLADPDALSLARNGDFRQGLAGWTADVSNFQKAGRIVADASSARLATTNAPRNGSLSLSQSVPVPAGTPLELSVAYRDDGSGVRHEWVVREKPVGKNITFSPPASTAWRNATFAWTPSSPNVTRVDVELRALVRSGSPGSVWVSNVTLARPVTVEWDFDADGVVDATGAPTKHAYAAGGAHDGLVTLRDAHGANATLAFSASVTRGKVDPLVTGPRAAGPGEAVYLAVDVAYADRNVLRDALFKEKRAWTLQRIGGANATYAATEGVATIAARGGAKESRVTLAQKATLTGAASYTFAVEARDTGGVLEYQYVLRESGFAVPEGSNATTEETVISVPAAPGGHAIVEAWKPRRADATTVEVQLRARLAPDAATDVAFANPRLVPWNGDRSGLAVTWRDGAGSESQGQAIRRFAFDAPGLHVIEVTVADTYGMQGSARHPLLVLDPRPSLTPTLDGRALLRWEFPLDAGATFSWTPEDRPRSQAPLAPAVAPAGARSLHETRVDLPKKATNYTLAANVPGLGAVTLATFALADLPAPLAAPALAEYAVRSRGLAVEARLAALDVADVEAVLVDAAGREAARIALEAGEDGVFRGAFASGSLKVFQTYSVRVEARDAFGGIASAVATGRPLVTPYPNVDPTGAPLLLLALALVAALAREAHARRGRKRAD